MKITKKIVSLISILVIILILSGCGNTTNTVNTAGSKNTTDSKNTTSTKSNTTNTSEEDVYKIDFLSYAQKQVATPAQGDTIAILHIKDYGDIKVKFFNDVAPKAVENFISLSESGYYNGVTFHRVINDFMIQGGDPTATGRGGQSKWGKSFEDEFDYSLVPYRGALCMANSGSNTNGSQFFIEQAKYDEQTYNLLAQNGYPKNLLEAYKQYGGSMHLFCRHTVFGQVIEGMDVLDKIAACEVDSNDKPVQDVIIKSIEITKF